MLLLPSGDLEKLELVGRGGFGNVYRGWSQTLKMEIALKVIQGACRSNLKRLMKDLMKERDVMEKASNPHVLRLLGLYEKVEGSFIERGLVMEYMPFGSLRSLFDDMQDVPWALRFQILHQVVLGMNFLHCLDPPIIHRDLKPCNVLLNKHLDIQITDFGLSKIAGATTSTVQSCAGTLSYMAPEALNDFDYEPLRSYDVYSFGILVWTIFSGEEPYAGSHPEKIQRLVFAGKRPKPTVLDQYSDVRMVPEAKELMIRCWDHNPDNRPSFHDCSECTIVMYQAYQEDVVSAARSVQDRLIKMSSSDQQGELTDYISGGTDEFLKALENKEISHAEEDLKTTVVSEKIEETFKNEEDMSGSDKLVKLVKESGDYKKLMSKFKDEGLMSEEQQQKLNSSMKWTDFTSATGKLIEKKIKNDPKGILKVFKF